MSIKMCPQVIYKKKRKSPFESLSGFSSAVFFFYFRDVSLCCSGIIPRPSRTTNSFGRRTRTVFPSWFWSPEINLFFFFCLLENVKQTSLKLSGWDWQPWQRANQEVVTRGEKRKEKGISLNVCKSEYKCPTSTKKKWKKKTKRDHFTVPQSSQQ